MFAVSANEALKGSNTTMWCLSAVNLKKYSFLLKSALTQTFCRHMTIGWYVVPLLASKQDSLLHHTNMAIF